MTVSRCEYGVWSIRLSMFRVGNGTWEQSSTANSGRLEMLWDVCWTCMTGQSVSIATALGQKESVGFLYTTGHQLLLRFGLPKHDVFIASGLIENCLSSGNIYVVEHATSST